MARHVGRCPRCKVGVAADELPEPRMLQHTCGAWVCMTPVIATVSTTPCDGRCMGAIGPVCNCECGGTNHGARFAQPVLFGFEGS